MKYEDVKDLQWADAEHTHILMWVKFEKFNEYLPFGANPNDSEAHGVELFNRAVAGDFGPIVEYVAPVEEVSPTPPSGDIPVTVTE